MFRAGVLATMIVSLAFSSLTSAADWPMYRADAGRSGYTPETLPGKLSVRWVRKARHAPMPAWPTSGRMAFDQTYQPVIADGLVFFGSSADGKIYALDAKTGATQWSYFTGGPIRFAPVVWQGRVFVASDDGHLYCLSAQDGGLQWKKRGGPDERMILGNDRMISRWPARGGPVVRDGVVYFAAGIWPSDGIYLHALDAKTGKSVWQNNKSGSIYMAQPHGGAYAKSGVSAQGYLVANQQQLFVPTGRAVPSAFDRATGKFQYFHLQRNRAAGGNDAIAVGDVLINSGLAFDAKTGATRAVFRVKTVAVAPNEIITAQNNVLTALVWKKQNKIDRKGKKIVVNSLVKAWTSKNIPGDASLIIAGKTIVVGGEKTITLVDRKKRTIAQTLKVDGHVHALAVAEGQLYAGTDKGTIYCFSPARGAGGPPAIVHQPRPAALPNDNRAAKKAVQEILAKTGIREGYCLDYGCGDGSLAMELARQTKLHIYAVDTDPKNVKIARERLDRAGLYGVRVTVHLATKGSVPYPKYFANLAVSGRSFTEGATAVDFDDMYRMQRPFGGLACVGKVGAMKKLSRGALPNAGSWTHQYADAANTCCSNDEQIKGPLGMLWFRDSDFSVPQRHGRGPAPLVYKGYLIVEGMHGLRCTDAYNGRTLWEYPLKNILKAYNADHLVGTAATGSNLCVGNDGVFVRVGTRCLRLDLATGKKLGEFTAPKLADGTTAPWGYLAYDDGIVFGSVVDNKHVVRHAYRRADMGELFSESKLFFAVDAKTGKQLWSFTPKHSLRHNAIAIGKGKVFLIDRELAVQDRRSGAVKKAQAPGTLFALDVRTGKERWRKAKNIWGTTLMLSPEHNVLVMSYQYTRFRLPSEIGGKLAAFHAGDGKVLWQSKAKYSTRPLLNGQTIYAQGGSWDLLTGEKRTFSLKRSYGCGQISSSRHLMLFRSATLGYYDLLAGKGSIDYGGMRPGCWINAIPAGGLVMVPDASSGCSCSYLNRAWIALQGMPEGK